MRGIKAITLAGVSLMLSTAISQSADLPPLPDDQYVPEVNSYDSGGWYLRGDIGYSILEVEGVSYFQGANLSGSFEQHELEDTWFVQGGIGYQATDYFRVDATLAYLDSSDFDGSSANPGSACSGGFAANCSYNDDAELESMLLLMANAYVDLGTVSGFTPYVGAGIGGAHVKYGDLLNDQTCDALNPACSNNDTIHPGEDQFRFAWALHAGASYDINCRWKADAGYTYTRIEGGRMFGAGTTAGGSFGGNGFDDGLEIHSGSIGLRYSLDQGGCGSPVENVNLGVFK